MLDILFYIGIALLPFENLVIAPTSGWATIAPLIFVPYILINYRYWNKVIAKYKAIFIIIFLVILNTLVNYFFINSNLQNAAIRNVSAFISLGLGVVSLFAFDIYLLERCGEIERLENIIFISYSIALFIGVVQAVTIKYDIEFIREIDMLISKRSYMGNNRVQFTFTEPSFIGMHIFGILFPVYLYGKKKKIRNLIICFCIASVLFGSGIRILLDILVVCVIFYLYKIDFRKVKTVILLSTSTTIILLSGLYLYNTNYRVRSIVKMGVYADGSFSARWFRINASIKGYQKKIPHALFGYGLGQEYLPLKIGYRDALAEYKNSYLVEVNSLRTIEQTAEESVSYCLYVRVISECGGIIFITLLIWFAFAYRRETDREWKMMMIITAYLYLQFESYAFYSIWFLIVLIKLKNIRRCREDIQLAKITKITKRLHYGQGKNNKKHEFFVNI